MDNNLMYQTSSLTIREQEVEEFTWSFKIPPRSKIQKNTESLAFGGFTFSGLQFKTGFLANLDHTWDVTFYANQVNVQMTFPPRDRYHRYSLKPSSLQLISLEEVKATHTLTFQQNGTVVMPINMWTAFWRNTYHSWDDSVDTVRITIRVEREISGTCQRDVSQECELRNTEILNSSKIIDSSEFFMSKHLSDVAIHCKGKIFPGHRFLLSCRSPVFSQMFQTEVKEQKEGLVIINDMEPEVLKQLLKFIYCGHVDSKELTLMSDTLIRELFQAAHKHKLEALKVLCEQEIVMKIGKENCLDMYAMGDLYDAKMVKEQSWEIIQINKRNIFRDRQTFKTFSAKYPDLIYELFRSSS